MPCLVASTLSPIKSFRGDSLLAPTPHSCGFTYLCCSTCACAFVCCLYSHSLALLERRNGLDHIASASRHGVSPYPSRQYGRRLRTLFVQVPRQQGTKTGWSKWPDESCCVVARARPSLEMPAKPAATQRITSHPIPSIGTAGRNPRMAYSEWSGLSVAAYSITNGSPRDQERRKKKAQDLTRLRDNQQHNNNARQIKCRGRSQDTDSTPPRQRQKLPQSDNQMSNNDGDVAILC